MNLKNLFWFCVCAIVTFIIMGLLNGNFEWFELDDLIPVVGGLIGVAVASYKARRINNTSSS
ncbi:hypothetical protein V7659_30450 [Neobacillus drentensis]|uniref:hypothetical protein n=1 Tax=Neobacillus drentensis TaxID=220684 RepID=UPI002FFFD7BF